MISVCCHRIWLWRRCDHHGWSDKLWLEQRCLVKHRWVLVNHWEQCLSRYIRWICHHRKQHQASIFSICYDRRLGRKSIWSRMTGSMSYFHIGRHLQACWHHWSWARYQTISSIWNHFPWLFLHHAVGHKPLEGMRWNHSIRCFPKNVFWNRYGDPVSKFVCRKCCGLI